MSWMSMASVDVSKYAHSPVHKAIILKDYDGLRRIVDGLPRLCDAYEIYRESVSLAEEAKADAIAAEIDRRDVPNRDTPLHLAVQFGDATATGILMLAGANSSLQNGQGWSALQEAIYNREEEIARIIVRHHEPLSWAKWCRKLPRLIGAMRRMRNFYMEMGFHCESSVIPFISRLAPSGTYKVWKRGANLMADMTLPGLGSSRKDLCFLFLGDGLEDRNISPGTLCVVTHKDREVVYNSDGTGNPATDARVQREVTTLSETSMFRPAIDVSQAVLVPQTTWRRREKVETVGPWKAKVYDMHNVVFSIKSRKAPGAKSDDVLEENEMKSELDDILTEEERVQLEAALKADSSEFKIENAEGTTAHHRSCHEQTDIPTENTNGRCNGDSKLEKKKWLGGLRRGKNKREDEKRVIPQGSLGVKEKVALPQEEDSKQNEGRRGRDTKAPAQSGNHGKDGNNERVFKKGLRPVLYLSPDFPLQIEELLPLLDILASRLHALRRVRELLTAKLPKGTVPVKVAFPIVSTIRLVVTFTKFEELQPLDEFQTPPSSPSAESGETTQSSSSSWFRRTKSSHQHLTSSIADCCGRTDDIQDPFEKLAHYTWITSEEKRENVIRDESKSKNEKR